MPAKPKTRAATDTARAAGGAKAASGGGEGAARPAHARELDKGKIEVEARLDLHGLRQRDAHAQLQRFLKSAQARGLKHVLVITGKGASLEASRSFYAEEERGVLQERRAALAGRA